MKLTVDRTLLIVIVVLLTFNTWNGSKSTPPSAPQILIIDKDSIRHEILEELDAVADSTGNIHTTREALRELLVSP